MTVNELIDKIENHATICIYNSKGKRLLHFDVEEREYISEKVLNLKIKSITISTQMDMINLYTDA